MEIKTIYTGDNIPRRMSVSDLEGIALKCVLKQGRPVTGKVEVKNVCTFKYSACLYEGVCIVCINRKWNFKEKTIKQYPLEPRFSRKANDMWRSSVRDNCSQPRPTVRDDGPVQDGISIEDVVAYLKSIMG